ncbi:MAG: site-2 protease family protein [Pseudomonadales bacterium]|jgi:Zn-dependent protease/CBS domain-containing protein|nr:site-2 protease family protein [Pseudomonadales bacterium]
MTDHRAEAPATRGPFGNSLRLFRILGIEVRLDLSVALIFWLIVFSLATGVFPSWHPDWSTSLVWSTAFLSGLAFFASLLAHELAHSVVALRFGIPVPRITLFLFGGVAETAREPGDARQEFLIAIAGPLMSLAIGVVCGGLARVLAGDEAIAERITSGDAAALAALTPTTTALLWLGSVNMVLAIFNLIPGFPMDGGRVFRAAVWAATGDQLKATRWAANGGRLFGWTLMGVGILSLLRGQALGGIWYILIGWFISFIAQASYTQLLTTRALRGFHVDDLMNTRFETVPASMPLQTFIADHLLHSTQPVWPVLRDEALAGFVCLKDVVAVAADDRAGKRVGDVARDAARMPTVDADAGARSALEGIGAADVESVPVLRRGRVVGFLSQGDLVRWMALHDLA